MTAEPPTLDYARRVAPKPGDPLIAALVAGTAFCGGHMAAELVMWPIYWAATYDRPVASMWGSDLFLFSVFIEIVLAAVASLLFAVTCVVVRQSTSRAAQPPVWACVLCGAAFDLARWWAQAAAVSSENQWRLFFAYPLVAAVALAVTGERREIAK